MTIATHNSQILGSFYIKRIIPLHSDVHLTGVNFGKPTSKHTTWLFSMILKGYPWEGYVASLTDDAAWTCQPPSLSWKYNKDSWVILIPIPDEDWQSHTLIPIHLVCNQQYSLLFSHMFDDEMPINWLVYLFLSLSFPFFFRPVHLFGGLLYHHYHIHSLRKKRLG